MTGARGWHSAEAERDPLLLPINRPRDGTHQLVGGQRWRVTAMQDRLRDVGCQPREPQQARRVGRIHLRAICELVDAGPLFVQQLMLLLLMRAGQQLDQRGVGFGSAARAGVHDQPGALADALQPHRDREDDGLLVAHHRNVSMVMVIRALLKDRGDPRRHDMESDAILPNLDALIPRLHRMFRSAA